jgi:hypothetical protein
MRLIKAGRLIEDRFVRVLDDAPVPEGVAAVLPATRLLADARDLVLRQAPTGVIWPSSLRIWIGLRSLLWCFRPSATAAPTVRRGSCANAINFAASCVQRVKSCAINCCFCIAPASTPSR